MRNLKWLAVAVGFMTSSVASAIPAATIKREVPLNVISYGTKGTGAILDSGPNARGIAFDGMQVWVVDGTSSTVQRFDYQSNTLKGTYNLPANSGPTDVVFDGTYAWVFTMSGVFKFKTDGTKVSGFPVTLPGGAWAWGAVFDGDNIWVGTSDGPVRIRVSDAAMTPFPGTVTTGALAFDGHDVWISAAGPGGLAKLDGVTGATLFFDPTYDGPSAVKGVAFDGRFIWVTSQGRNLIEKWDPTTNTVIASIPTYPDPRGMAFDGTYLWVACSSSSAVMKIDVRTNQVVDAIPFPAGSYPINAVFDGTHVWVAVPSNGDPDPGHLYKFFAKFN